MRVGGTRHHQRRQHPAAQCLLLVGRRCMARDCAMKRIGPQHPRPCPRPPPAHRARSGPSNSAPAGTSRRDRLPQACRPGRSTIRASRAAAAAGVSPSGSVEISTTRVTRSARPADHVQRDGAAQPLPGQRKARRAAARARPADMSSTSAPCSGTTVTGRATATVRRSDGRRLAHRRPDPGSGSAVRSSGNLVPQSARSDRGTQASRSGGRRP